MDSYFKVKYFLDYALPAAVLLLSLIIWIACVIYSTSREKKIHKFFTSHGYKRKLLDVPSVGDGAFYGWIRDTDRTVVDDRDIAGMSLKSIKKKYK